ncbi:MAG: twin-arginine translocation signal domain-containing protein, partial [Dehalococcoidia bacterium]
MDISRRNLLKMLGIAGGAAVVGAAAGGYAARSGAQEDWPEEWRVADY